jgi:hypothetical protein
LYRNWKEWRLACRLTLTAFLGGCAVPVPGAPILPKKIPCIAECDCFTLFAVNECSYTGEFITLTGESDSEWCGAVVISCPIKFR